MRKYPAALAKAEAIRRNRDLMNDYGQVKMVPKDPYEILGIKKNSNLDLVSLIKELFKPGEVWRSEDLGWRANLDCKEVEKQLRKFRAKEVDGIIIFRSKGIIGRNSWHYKSIQK